MKNIALRAALPAVALFLLASCEGTDIQSAGENPTLDEQVKSGRGGKLFGDISIGGREEREGDGGGSGIGVNGYLWRASLDTLAFLPLTSADPFGGVIITDWYAPPESPDERFKVTVYLLGRQLRADGVRVSVFRQTRAARADWADAVLSDDTKTQLEDAILTRARELRIAGNSG